MVVAAIVVIVVAAVVVVVDKWEADRVQEKMSILYFISASSTPFFAGSRCQGDCMLNVFKWDLQIFHNLR